MLPTRQRCCADAPGTRSAQVCLSGLIRQPALASAAALPSADESAHNEADAAQLAALKASESTVAGVEALAMTSTIPMRLSHLFAAVAFATVGTDIQSQTTAKQNAPRTAPAAQEARAMRDLPPSGTPWTDAQVIDFVQSLTEINSIPTLFERSGQVRDLGKGTAYDALTERLRSDAISIDHHFERLDAAVQQNLALAWTYRETLLDFLRRARGGEPLALKSMRATAQSVSKVAPIDMQLALLHFGQATQELQAKCTAQPADTLCRSLLAMVREGDPKMAGWHARTYASSSRAASGTAAAYAKYQDFSGGADFGAWVKWALASGARGDARQLSLVHLVATANVRGGVRLAGVCPRGREGDGDGPGDCVGGGPSAIDAA